MILINEWTIQGRSCRNDLWHIFCRLVTASPAAERWNASWQKEQHACCLLLNSAGLFAECNAKLQRSNVCMFLVQEARNQASNRPRVSNNVFYTVIHNVATHYALHTMYCSDSDTSAAAAAASFFSTVSGSAAGSLHTARHKA